MNYERREAVKVKLPNLSETSVVSDFLMRTNDRSIGRCRYFAMPDKSARDRRKKNAKYNCEKITAAAGVRFANIIHGFRNVNTRAGESRGIRFFRRLSVLLDNSKFSAAYVTITKLICVDLKFSTAAFDGQESDVFWVPVRFWVAENLIGNGSSKFDSSV